LSGIKRHFKRSADTLIPGHTEKTSEWFRGHGHYTFDFVLLTAKSKLIKKMDGSENMSVQK